MNAIVIHAEMVQHVLMELTNTLVNAFLDIPAYIVKLILMNVRQIHALTAVFVLILLMDSSASAREVIMTHDA